MYTEVVGSLSPYSSASALFVMNNVSNFETLSRKSMFAFKTRLSNSDNTVYYNIILYFCTITKAKLTRKK